MSAMRSIATAPVRFYQRAISPGIPRALQVPSELLRVRRPGDPRATVCCAASSWPRWRLLRCNPWSHGGVDPVEDQKLFRARPRTER